MSDIVECPEAELLFGLSELIEQQEILVEKCSLDVEEEEARLMERFTKSEHADGASTAISYVQKTYLQRGEYPHYDLKTLKETYSKERASLRKIIRTLDINYKLIEIWRTQQSNNRARTN